MGIKIDYQSFKNHRAEAIEKSGWLWLSSQEGFQFSADEPTGDYVLYKIQLSNNPEIDDSVQAFCSLLQNHGGFMMWSEQDLIRLFVESPI